MFNVECSMEGKGPRDERKDRGTMDDPARGERRKDGEKRKVMSNEWKNRFRF